VIEKSTIICYNGIMKEFVFVVDQQFNNVKPLIFLSKKGVSDEIIKKVKFGGVFINGVVLKNANENLNFGDEVKMVLPPDRPNPYITPIKGKIDVVYEDDYILAVNKPKGMLTHSSMRNKTIALDQLVCGYFLPKPFTFRAINRLDKDTSGIVLVAKDIFTASLLGEQIKKGEIVKTYSALVKGAPNEDFFIIEKPIKRPSQSDIKRICASDGKYAKSECKVVNRLTNGNSIIEVKLITGRTHQIRVHLSSIGFPLYADGLYGESVQGETYSLCAKKLQFIHPITKKETTIEIAE
jgi:23S rRNA pseudouridine1911/1915/1917 synthase